jgi:hypothetical protein
VLASVRYRYTNTTNTNNALHSLRPVFGTRAWPEHRHTTGYGPEMELGRVSHGSC